MPKRAKAQGSIKSSWDSIRPRVTKKEKRELNSRASCSFRCQRKYTLENQLSPFPARKPIPRNSHRRLNGHPTDLSQLERDLESRSIILITIILSLTRLFGYSRAYIIRSSRPAVYLILGYIILQHVFVK